MKEREGFSKTTAEGKLRKGGQKADCTGKLPEIKENICRKETWPSVKWGDGRVNSQLFRKTGGEKKRTPTSRKSEKQP